MALDFDLTEEQEMVRKMVRTFAEKELGLFGFCVSEEYGGSDMGYLSYIIATEEIARIDGSQAATLAAGCSLGISPIYQFGNEDQKRQWLPDLVTGKALASFGLTEPDAGSDAGATKTTATLEDDHWTINGSKIFISNSSTEISAVCVVQAVNPCTERWSGALPIRENSISRTAKYPGKTSSEKEARDSTRCWKPLMGGGSASALWAWAVHKGLSSVP